MDSQPSTIRPQHLLRAVLRIMAPLVRWLVRSGVGYTEFAAALKPVFLDEAQLESQRCNGKQTDSALSLLSGLHRKDIRKIAADLNSQATADTASLPVKPGLPWQLVTHWIAAGLPDSLPLSGEGSFEELARTLSVDVHPRTIQHELVRLGIAAVQDGQVQLLQRAPVTDPRTLDAQQLVADGVADHLAAGVHNLTSGMKRKHLEQAVFADGLTAASVRQLEQLSKTLWQDAMKRMVDAAVPLCKQDASRGGDQRMRLGMYCYAEPMPGQTETEVSNP